MTKKNRMTSIKIPKQVENPMDIAILMRLKFGSPRRIAEEIDRRIEEITTNDIVTMSVLTLQWNLIRAFVEDMALDKTRLMIKRLLKTK